MNPYDDPFMNPYANPYYYNTPKGAWGRRWCSWRGSRPWPRPPSSGRDAGPAPRAGRGDAARGAMGVQPGRVPRATSAAGCGRGRADGRGCPTADSSARPLFPAQRRLTAQSPEIDLSRGPFSRLLACQGRVRHPPGPTVSGGRRADKELAAPVGPGPPGRSVAWIARGPLAAGSAGSCRWPPCSPAGARRSRRRRRRSPRRTSPRELNKIVDARLCRGAPRHHPRRGPPGPAGPADRRGAAWCGPTARSRLDFYGDVYVAGLTTNEIKEKVVIHLRKYLSRRRCWASTTSTRRPASPSSTKDGKIMAIPAERRRTASSSTWRRTTARSITSRATSACRADSRHRERDGAGRAELCRGVHRRPPRPRTSAWSARPRRPTPAAPSSCR